MLHAQIGSHEMLILGLAMRETLSDTRVSHLCVIWQITVIVSWTKYCTNLWISCNIILPFCSCMNCFDMDETNTCNLLSRRQKTPSLLFVHIEAFFIKDESPSYAMKFYLRRSIFVFNEAFYHRRQTSSIFSC